jgi:AraC family transcriptional regulator of arabinose operon
MGWAGEFAFVGAGVVFRGEAADNRPHLHATVQLTLGLDGQVTIDETSPGGTTRSASGPALLVRPGIVHALRAGPRVLLVLLPPQTRLAQRILQAAPAGGVAALPQDLTAVIDSTGPLIHSLDALQAPSTVAPPADERFKRALAFLAITRGPRPIERAAAVAGLSVSRLRALAQAHLEVPLSRWLTLRQLQRAGLSLARGASLAEAAADAGFADQAHLTRQMRRTFGVTPATVAALVRAAPRRFVQDEG